MPHTISFEVTVERHEPSGAFVARCVAFPGKVGIGLTEDEAVADLRVFALIPVPPLPFRPSASEVNPWVAAIGTLPNDEVTAEWKRIIQERRDVYDDSEPGRE
jgi:hypothetical protein